MSMSTHQKLQVQAASRAVMAERQREWGLLSVRTVRLEGISSGMRIQQIQVMMRMLTRAHSVVLAESLRKWDH